MKNRFRFAGAVSLAIAAVLALSSCASVYAADEDRSATKEMGQTSEVSVGFNFLVFYERGPYKARITPLGVVPGKSGGAAVDCVKLEYEVLSTPDGKPAEYATCTTAVNLLTEDLDEVEFGIWCSDDQGTQMDPRNAELEVGKRYTFYIPLVSSFGENRKLSYVTVSDRSGFYQRAGATYWYPVT